MSIVEFHGGPVTHRYLMRKTRSELERIYAQNQHAHGFVNGLLTVEDLRALPHKDSVAAEILRQFRRMPD